MVETPYTLALAATFAAAPLSETLRFWIRESGIASDLVEAPPDQLLDHLREADGVLRSATVDLGVAAVRFSDLDGGAREVEAWIDSFGDAVRSRRRVRPLLVVRCAEALETARERDWEERLRLAVSEAPDVEFVGAGMVLDLYPAVDPAGGPNTTADEYCAALGTAIARRVHARRTRRRSVLVLDCEGTLWRGPCGDTHPSDLLLDESHRAIQEFARDRADEGWTLALYGQCDALYVRRAFRAHPEWPLRLSDFRVVTVGWTSKAAQIGALAREIGAPASDMVVIDNQQANCLSVRVAHPGILALRLPSAGPEPGVLLRHVWEFDRAPVGSQHGLRPTKAEVSGERGHPRVVVRLAEREDFSAIASLSRRAERLNANGTRVSEEELAWFAGEPGRAILMVSAGATSALVAAARIREVAGAVRVEDWWMEHDLADGIVESHLLRGLGRMAVAAGVERVEIACLRTRASEPVRRFLEGRGARAREHEFEISFAAALGSVDAGCGCASCAPNPSVARTRTREARHSLSLRTPARLLKAMRSGARGEAPSSPPFRLPTTDAERWVSNVWREVLGVERVGAHDDFFALGGDSLSATRAMARIRAAFGVDLPITTVFEEPTLAAQAARLVAARIEASDPSLVRTLLEEEGMRVDG